MDVWHEKTDKLPRVGQSDRMLYVYVHDDAMMYAPRSDWMWSLRYADEPDRGTLCSDRVMAASLCEDIRYLALECTKDEAWHRLMQIRKALIAYDKPQD